MNRIAVILALAAGIACAAFGYEPPRHNDTFTTNGVTYAQRGGLGASDYVVTNIDASAVGKVKSVNTKTGDVVLNAQDVGARAKDDFSAENRWVMKHYGVTYILRSSGGGWTDGSYMLDAAKVSTEEGSWAHWHLYNGVDYLGYTTTPWSEVNTVQELTIAGHTLRRGLRLVDDYDLAYGVTNIQKSALSSGVQTSLDKADGALQKSGDKMTGDLEIAPNKKIRFVNPPNLLGGSVLELSKEKVSYTVGGNPILDAYWSDLATEQSVEDAVTTATNELGQAITAVEAKTPNNITRTGTDATLVHCDNANCTNALVYIRHATSSLAGLMTAADKSAFDTMKTTVSNHETAIEAVTNDNAQTRQIVTTWENFLDGSNVVFSITNYISGAYTLDTAKLKILELKDGAYQEVYNSRDEILLHIQDFKTNDFRVATNQVIGAVNAAIGSKADKDWGKYTSAGGEAPENTVYMTAPNTVFAGGLEYERVAVGEGTICVLTTHGAPVWTQGDEGTFKFQDDGGTNYFGFAKTDSYTIGANTDGITVSGGMVTMTYNITMSGRPCVWYKADLTSNTPWEQLNLPDGSPVAGASHTVTWEQNPPAGTQVCYINVGNQPQGFFRATVEVAGEAKFMTNMPADLSGGIICPNTATGVNGVIKPTFNGSTVQWTWSAQ